MVSNGKVTAKFVEILPSHFATRFPQVTQMWHFSFNLSGQYATGLLKGAEIIERWNRFLISGVDSRREYHSYSSM
jgi:hypothetical protein